MRKKRFVGDEILDVFSTDMPYFKLTRVKELNKNFSSPAMNIFRCFWTQCQVPDVVVVVWGGCMMVYDLLQ